VSPAKIVFAGALALALALPGADHCKVELKQRFTLGSRAPERVHAIEEVGMLLFKFCPLRKTARSGRARKALFKQTEHIRRKVESPKQQPVRGQEHRDFRDRDGPFAHMEDEIAKIACGKEIATDLEFSS
jgi:hypothetical protein